MCIRDSLFAVFFIFTGKLRGIFLVLAGNLRPVALALRPFCGTLRFFLLDVYKSQEKNKEDCDAFQASKTTMFLTETVLVRVPVSYTHLDVYKRQGV